VYSSTSREDLGRSRWLWAETPDVDGFDVLPLAKSDNVAFLPVKFRLAFMYSLKSIVEERTGSMLFKLNPYSMYRQKVQMIFTRAAGSSNADPFSFFLFLLRPKRNDRIL
jgi:hypothetical protein